jgi:hypothetical protein
VKKITAEEITSWFQNMHSIRNFIADKKEEKKCHRR